jgi:hypothetical protein
METKKLIRPPAWGPCQVARTLLFPCSGLVGLLLLAEGFFQVDLKTIGQVQEIAEDIGKFLFESTLVLLCLLAVQAFYLAYGLG